MFIPKNIGNKIQLIVILFSFSFSSIGQIITLDTTQVETVAVKVKKEFTKDDFIRMTKTDTSFYRAFKNLKMFPHKASNKVEVFDKSWTSIGEMERESSHFSTGKEGWIVINKEISDGKYYNKKGNHKYFTAEMYDKVFFSEDTFLVNNTVSEAYSQEKLRGMSTKDKYYEKLKTFMFSPGTGVKGVPIIGKKLNIYEGKMMELYDFNLEKTFFKDTVPVFKFSVIQKSSTPDKEIVILKIITFYDRRTMQVIARSYALKDRNTLMEFDIKMYIELKHEFGEYLPVTIKYNGEWDVPFKKTERIKFKMSCSDYELPVN
jgi:hypothetical protein